MVDEEENYDRLCSGLHWGCAADDNGLMWRPGHSLCNSSYCLQQLLLWWRRLSNASSCHRDMIQIRSGITFFNFSNSAKQNSKLTGRKRETTVTNLWGLLARQPQLVATWPERASSWTPHIVWAMLYSVRCTTYPCEDEARLNSV